MSNSASNEKSKPKFTEEEIKEFKELSRCNNVYKTLANSLGYLKIF